MSGSVTSVNEKTTKDKISIIKIIMYYSLSGLVILAQLNYAVSKQVRDEKNEHHLLHYLPYFLHPRLPHSATIS